MENQKRGSRFHWGVSVMRRDGTAQKMLINNGPTEQLGGGVQHMALRKAVVPALFLQRGDTDNQVIVLYIPEGIRLLLIS